MGKVFNSVKKIGGAIGGATLGMVTGGASILGGMGIGGAIDARSAQMAAVQKAIAKQEAAAKKQLKVAKEEEKNQGKRLVSAQTSARLRAMGASSTLGQPYVPFGQGQATTLGG